MLCTGDAATNGPRNKLWDANVANWPRVIDKAAALGPQVVLPGHGASGGIEILRGQAQFLRDLYAQVAKSVREHKTVEQATSDLQMPSTDPNWVRTDMAQDVGIVYAEIKAGKPAGALPHTWQ